MTYAEFRDLWEAMTPLQRNRVKEKAAWEHMTLWAVLREWHALAGDQQEGWFGSPR